MLAQCHHLARVSRNVSWAIRIPYEQSPSWSPGTKSLLHTTLYSYHAKHRHAGCGCSDEWTGPHCEISVAVIQAAQADEDRSIVTHAFGVAVIVLAVLAIGAVATFSTVMYCRQRRRRNAAKAKNNNRLRWGPAYTDSNDDNNINLAPRQSFYDAEFPAAAMSSSRDPMAHMGAAHPAHNIKATAAMTDDDDQGPPEPQIYIGPPRDEDGHVLHSVEIL